LVILKLKKTHVGASRRESIKGVEVHIGGNPKSDNFQALISKTLRGSTMAGRGSQNMTDESVG